VQPDHGSMWCYLRRRRVMLEQSRQSRLKVGLLRLSVAEPTEASRSRKIGPDRTLDSPDGARISMSNLTRGLELA
jgi:hypothetical protein